MALLIRDEIRKIARIGSGAISYNILLAVCSTREPRGLSASTETKHGRKNKGVSIEKRERRAESNNTKEMTAQK